MRPVELKVSVFAFLFVCNMGFLFKYTDNSIDKNFKICYTLQTLWHYTQAVRERSAKPWCIGSIPIGAFQAWTSKESRLFLFFKQIFSYLVTCFRKLFWIFESSILHWKQICVWFFFRCKNSFDEFYGRLFVDFSVFDDKYAQFITDKAFSDSSIACSFFLAAGRFTFSMGLMGMVSSRNAISNTPFRMLYSFTQVAWDFPVFW